VEPLPTTWHAQWVRRATLPATALYEAELNGSRVGDEELTPVGVLSAAVAGIGG